MHISMHIATAFPLIGCNDSTNYMCQKRTYQLCTTSNFILAFKPFRHSDFQLLDNIAFPIHLNSHFCFSMHLLHDWMSPVYMTTFTGDVI